MASRITALPRDSHEPSHAAVHKNKLCDSTLPSWRERSQVAGPSPVGRQGQLRGKPNVVALELNLTLVESTHHATEQAA